MTHRCAKGRTGNAANRQLHNPGKETLVVDTKPRHAKQEPRRQLTVHLDTRLAARAVYAGGERVGEVRASFGRYQAVTRLGKLIGTYPTYGAACAAVEQGGAS